VKQRYIFFFVDVCTEDLQLSAEGIKDFIPGARPVFRLCLLWKKPEACLCSLPDLGASSIMSFDTARNQWVLCESDRSSAATAIAASVSVVMASSLKQFSFGSAYWLASKPSKRSWDLAVADWSCGSALGRYPVPPHPAAWSSVWTRSGSHRAVRCLWLAWRWGGQLLIQQMQAFFQVLISANFHRQQKGKFP